MNLFKKLTLSIFFVTLVTSSYSYFVENNYFYPYLGDLRGYNYNIYEDLDSSVELLQKRINSHLRAYEKPRNITLLTYLITDPIVISLLIFYSYYRLNKDYNNLQEKIKALETNKPQQATLEKLQELIDILETKDTTTEDTEKQPEEDTSNTE